MAKSSSRLAYSALVLGMLLAVTTFGNFSFTGDFFGPPVEPDPEVPTPSGVLFEYGAESGSLSAVFDQVGGGSDPKKRRIQIVSSVARTGSHSIELYQPPPHKTDADRRCVIKVYQDSLPSKHKEFYVSYWVLFPKESPWTTSDNSWCGFGKPSLWFGPPDNRHAYHINMPSFSIRKSTREIYVSLVWHKLFETSRYEIQRNSGYIVKNHLKQWVHFQAYVKVSEHNSVLRAWVNDKLVFEKTSWTKVHEGVKFKSLDPSTYTEWDKYNCGWHSPCAGGYPRWCVELYSGQDSKEKRIFVDDLVWSTTKIPENYGVQS